MIEKLKRWWRYTKIRQIFRDYKQGMQNVWRWFPVVWKDRDWDQYFIYEILKTKLEKQAIHIYNNGNHVDAKYDAERMLLCARLIEMQQEELYESEWTDSIYDESFKEYFKKYPRQYKRALAGGFNRNLESIKKHEEDIIAMEIAWENQKRSRKLLFRILEQNITRWWD